MGIKGENATALQQIIEYFSSFYPQITAQANNDENMTHSLRNSLFTHFRSFPSVTDEIILFSHDQTGNITTRSVALKLENCDKEFNKKNRCEIQKSPLQPLPK